MMDIGIGEKPFGLIGEGWRKELINDSGQLDLRYGAYRRYLALDNWKIGLLNSSYLRHKRAFDKEFYTYNTYGKSFGSIVEFFTSAKSHIVYLDTGELQICLAYLYYNKKLTGAKLVNLVADSYNYNAYTRGVTATIQLGMDKVYTCSRNELFYKVINGGILNLHLDNQGRLMYGTPYLSQQAYVNDRLRPIKLYLPYELESKRHPYMRNSDLDDKELELYNKRRKALSKLDVTDDFITADFDIGASNFGSRSISWKYGAISKIFEKNVEKVTSMGKEV